MINEEAKFYIMSGWEGKYPSGVACVRQTDAWCRPGGSPVGTLCAPAGLVRQAGSGDSGCGGGRTGVQSGEGGHTRDLKNDTGKQIKLGLRYGSAGMKEEQQLCDDNICMATQREVQICGCEE